MHILVSSQQGTGIIRANYAANRANPGIREGRDELPQPVRRGDAIAIDKRQQREARQFRAAIATQRRSQPARVTHIVSAACLEQPIPGRVRYQRACRVAGSVVHHDHFQAIRRVVHPRERIAGTL